MFFKHLSDSTVAGTIDLIEVGGQEVPTGRVPACVFLHLSALYVITTTGGKSGKALAPASPTNQL